MIIFILILIPAILLAWRFFYGRMWARGLDVHLSFAEDMVYAGEQAQLTEVIRNCKRLPLTEVEIGFQIRQGVRFVDAENIVTSDYIYKRDVFSLRGMEAVTRRYHMDCIKRGRYRIHQVTMRAWSFFHDTEYSAELGGTDELLVYAEQTDVSKIVTMCDTVLGTVESAHSLYEDPFLFASIREYTPQDPMKHINWKASARMGNLMVNTYASVRSEQFTVFLDVADRRIVKETELVEKGISAAASLCRRLISQGQEIGLAVNTVPPTVFEPRRGQRQLREIERFLTEDFAERELMELEEFAELSVQLRDRICIYISKEMDRELGLRVRSRMDRAMPAILVVPVLEESAPALKVWGI